MSFTITQVLIAYAATGLILAEIVAHGLRRKGQPFDVACYVIALTAWPIMLLKIVLKK